MSLHGSVTKNTISIHENHRPWSQSPNKFETVLYMCWICCVNSRPLVFYTVTFAEDVVYLGSSDLTSSVTKHCSL